MSDFALLLLTCLSSFIQIQVRVDVLYVYSLYMFYARRIRYLGTQFLSLVDWIIKNDLGENFHAYAYSVESRKTAERNFYSGQLYYVNSSRAKRYRSSCPEPSVFENLPGKHCNKSIASKTADWLFRVASLY